MLDLNKSPLSALVAEFNKITGQNVKRFPDRKTAIKRLSAVMPAKKIATKNSKGANKKHRLLDFIRVPRSVEEICEAFAIKSNTVSNYLSGITHPVYCVEFKLESPAVIKRVDGKVVVS